MYVEKKRGQLRGKNSPGRLRGRQAAGMNQLTSQKEKKKRNDEMTVGSNLQIQFTNLADRQMERTKEREEEEPQSYVTSYQPRERGRRPQKAKKSIPRSFFCVRAVLGTTAQHVDRERERIVDRYIHPSITQPGKQASKYIMFIAKRLNTASPGRSHTTLESIQLFFFCCQPIGSFLLLVKLYYLTSSSSVDSREFSSKLSTAHLLARLVASGGFDQTFFFENQLHVGSRQEKEEGKESQGGQQERIVLAAITGTLFFFLRFTQHLNVNKNMSISLQNFCMVNAVTMDNNSIFHTLSPTESEQKKEEEDDDDENNTNISAAKTQWL